MTTNQYGKVFSTEEAKAFLLERNNRFKCKDCPMSQYRHECDRYECGQYNCWVVLCAPKRKDEG